MRGSKAKALRAAATQALRHGTKIGIKAPLKGQAVANPFRCLYQALKNRRQVSILS